MCDSYVFIFINVEMAREFLFLYSTNDNHVRQIIH
jgi:hypothetical protein